jgi:hypothetical protein
MKVLSILSLIDLIGEIQVFLLKSRDSRNLSHAKSTILIKIKS